MSAAASLNVGFIAAKRARVYYCTKVSPNYKQKRSILRVRTGGKRLEYVIFTIEVRKGSRVLGL